MLDFIFSPTYIIRAIEIHCIGWFKKLINPTNLSGDWY